MQLAPIKPKNETNPRAAESLAFQLKCPKRELQWIRAKHLKKLTRKSSLFTDDFYDRGIFRDTALMSCDEVKIRRHKKVKMGANPFDPTWDAHVETDNANVSWRNTSRDRN